MEQLQINIGKMWERNWVALGKHCKRILETAEVVTGSYTALKPIRKAREQWSRNNS